MHPRHSWILTKKEFFRLRVVDQGRTVRTGTLQTTFLRCQVESKEDDAFTVLVVGPSGVVAARKPVGNAAPSDRELLTSYEPVDFSKPITGLRAYARHVLPGKPEDYAFRNRLGGETIAPSAGPASGYDRSHGL